MTDEKLRDIFDRHAEKYGAILWHKFRDAISDYESEKAKEKQITPVKPSDTEIIEYYEQVAKEDLPEKETCKWVIDSDDNSETSCGKCDAWYEDMKYCPNCGKPIEVIE